eukprot:scaffold200691_cov33-Tisochrysis_lutea.AAC.1
MRDMRGSLPADVATDDDVTADDGLGRDVGVDEVRNDGGGHGELNRRGIDATDDVAGAWRLEDAEEGAIEAILGVELNDLLVVIGALKELDTRVERPAVSLEQDLDGVHRRVEGVGAEGATLDGHRGRDALVRRLVNAVGPDAGGKGELELAD